MRRVLLCLVGMLCLSFAQANANNDEALLDGALTNKKIASSNEEELAEAPKVGIELAEKKRSHTTHATVSVALPNVSPTKMSAVAIGLVWLSIFSAGMCALCGVQTPLRFEEKGIMMSKEY